MLIVDGLEDQKIYLKCDIRGKIFPMHMRFKSKRCTLDIYYSYQFTEPSSRGFDKHFLVNGDKVIKIENSEGSDG